MVAAGGVAEFLDEVGQHRLKDSGVHRGRGVIVHENWELHRIAPSPNCSRLSSMTVESRLRHDSGRTEFLHVLELKRDRKSTRLNSSHGYISYAVFCLKKKKKTANKCR